MRGRAEVACQAHNRGLTFYFPGVDFAYDLLTIPIQSRDQKGKFQDKQKNNNKQNKQVSE